MLNVPFGIRYLTIRCKLGWKPWQRSVQQRFYRANWDCNRGNDQLSNGPAEQIGMATLATISSAKVLPRFELGSPDSEFGVLTVTPQSVSPGAHFGLGDHQQQGCKTILKTQKVRKCLWWVLWRLCNISAQWNVVSGVSVSATQVQTIWNPYWFSLNSQHHHVRSRQGR